MIMVLMEIIAYAAVTYFLGKADINLALAFATFMVYSLLVSLVKVYRHVREVKKAISDLEIVNNKSKLDKLMGRDEN